MIKISFSFKKQIQYKYLANIQKLKFYKNIKKIIKNNFFNNNLIKNLIK